MVGASAKLPAHRPNGLRVDGAPIGCCLAVAEGVSYAEVRPVLALLTFFLVPLPATAAPGGSSDNFPARIDLPNGFAPEGIESGKGTSVFVGSLIDGAIWRGDLRTGEDGAVLAEGEPGRVSVGIAYEASRDRLWVAGGGPAFLGAGDVRVYDATSGELLATYTPSGVGFLNDVTITKDAVYVTDSIGSELVKISLPADGSLPSTAEKLPSHR